MDTYFLNSFFDFNTININFTLGKSEFVLGHCKFSIYSPQRIGPISTWEVEQGRAKRLLHPGILTQNLESIGDIPNASYRGMFQNCFKLIRPTFLNHIYI